MTTTTITTLNDRQERFVIEYLKDCNASAAAARAGYTAKNKASAGNEVLRHPAVRARVRGELRALLAYARSSALALMEQRIRAAFFDTNALFAPDGRVLEADEMDPGARSLMDGRVQHRKSGPLLTLRTPNRERALAALEKVHERLDRMDEEYFNSLPEDEEPAAPVPRPGWLGPAPGAAASQEDAGFFEKPQDLSGFEGEEEAVEAEEEVEEAVMEERKGKETVRDYLARVREGVMREWRVKPGDAKT